MAVGISTTANVTVSSVTFGAQVLAPQQQVAADGVRSETWSLTSPNPGTANVTVTLSGAAPVIAGATTFAGRRPGQPDHRRHRSGDQNTASNAASFVTNGTEAKDGMFGTIVISPASQTGAITTQGSVDTVVADNRWSTSTGSIRGAGSTRIGWTGANLSLNSGIVWRWTNVGGLVSHAFTWLALKAGTVAPPPNTAPTANPGGPYSVTEDGSLTLSGSGTDADNDSLSYSWDVNGDGTYGDATGANPTLSAAQRDALGLDDGPASFSVRVQVSDAKATTTSPATALNITNTAPNATVSNGGPVDEGSTATVAFSNVDRSVRGRHRRRPPLRLRLRQRRHLRGRRARPTPPRPRRPRRRCRRPSSPTAPARARSRMLVIDKDGGAHSTRPRSRSTTSPRPPSSQA